MRLRLRSDEQSDPVHVSRAEMNVVIPRKPRWRPVAFDELDV